MSAVHISRDVVLEPADNNRLANLCGQFDEHLRQIERRLDVEIASRGNRFRITGRPGAAEVGGDVLARLDTSRLEAQRTEWRAQLREVKARLELARLTLDRRKERAGKDSISAQRYDEARFEAMALEARLASITAGLERVEIDIAQSSLEAPFADKSAAVVEANGRAFNRGADEAEITAVLGEMADRRGATVEDLRARFDGRIPMLTWDAHAERLAEFDRLGFSRVYLQGVASVAWSVRNALAAIS